MAKGRRFTPAFKARVGLEELTGVKDKAEICREYRVSSQVFSRWRVEFVVGSAASRSGGQRGRHAR